MKKCRFSLLIDDDPVENLINRKLLERLDFSKTISAFLNGYEGMNFLRILLQTNNPPDVIFLDLNMPIMDGFEFMKNFRLLPDEFRKHIKIFVLTSSISENDFKIASTLGCDGYLTKPLTKEKIIAEFERVFPQV